MFASGGGVTAPNGRGIGFDGGAEGGVSDAFDEGVDEEELSVTVEGVEELELLGEVVPGEVAGR